MKMKFLGVVFFGVVIVQLIPETDASELDDPVRKNGICNKRVSYTATRYEPYIETYRVSKWGIFYETKERWNYRKEYYTAYRTEKECCSGYIGTLFGECEPECDPKCVYAKCTSPNVCTCQEGYEPNPENSFTCEPICYDHCLFGTCTAPNTCTCNSGYKPSENNYAICEPICEQSCINGFCSEPNRCKCKAGYRSTKNDSNICEPVCKEDCTNGFCSAPNVCSCKEGYRLSETSSDLCEPVCSKSCGINGVCNAPDTCACKEGYKSINDDETTFSCFAVCEFECGNGTCTAPNECTCHMGYEASTEGPCEPTCESCNNGTCVEPDVCECHEGFTKVKEGNRSICEPYCENCLNGKCVAPDDCRCNVGYIKFDNDSDCVNACEKNCHDRGLCNVENGTCECYYGWSGMHCEKPEFCIETIDNTDEQLWNIQDDVNDTISYVFENSPLCYQNCFDEINNDTLCFGKYKIRDRDNYTIACLVSTDSNCYRPLSEHVKTNNYMTVAKISGIATGVAAATIGSAAAIYVLTRKQRTRRHSLGNAPATSAQGQTALLPEDESRL